MILHIEEIYDTYCFDKKFRNLLVGVLESIEIEFRTHIAYHIAHKYGALGHLDNSNFIKAYFHEKYVSAIESEIDRNREDLFITHHKTKYNGQVPIWVVMEICICQVKTPPYSNPKLPH